jgi:hypothetical protein
MTVWEWAVSVIMGLVVNECCDLSPALARRLVRWSARCRYQDASRAEQRAEELAAYIDDRPGKLFKLVVAFGFAVQALVSMGERCFAPAPIASSYSLEPLRQVFSFAPYQHEDADVWQQRARLMRSEWERLCRDVDAAEAASGKRYWGFEPNRLRRLAKATGKADWRIAAGNVGILWEALHSIERMPDEGAGPIIGSPLGRACLRPERYATPTQAEAGAFCDAVRRCRNDIRQLAGAPPSGEPA